MKKLSVLLLAFAVSFGACMSQDPSLGNRTDQITATTVDASTGSGSDTGTGTSTDGTTTVDTTGTTLTSYGVGDLIPSKKDVNCQANKTFLIGAAVTLLAIIALSAWVIADIAAGAGAGTALATAWADLVASIGAVKSAADLGAAVALLVEKYKSVAAILAGIGATAAELGISDAAKKALDVMMDAIKAYATNWDMYYQCCYKNDDTACQNMPANVF